MSFNLGKVRRWIDDGILFAENDCLHGAFVVTDDASKIGKMECYGPNKIFVEFISADQGALWQEK